MGFISSSLLAISMSTDAFAVSLSKGASNNKTMFSEALRIGAIFGAVEATTPILGWLTGLVASSYIKDVDHWFAFTILTLVGVKFIYESFKSDDNQKSEEKQHKTWLLVLTALATSIDAFAVGISLAFVDYNIITAALSIGIATFIMVTIGIMSGRLLNKKIGVYAERLGGILLILIGFKILLEHLNII